MLFSPAYADIAPEPETPADDTASSEDTAEGSEEEKSGCSSMGTTGMSILPILCIGFVAFIRTREEE
jgi:hypothetical protein